MEAARMGHAEAVKVLISNGADINVQNKNTWTAAHYAAAVSDCTVTCTPFMYLYHRAMLIISLAKGGGSALLLSGPNTNYTGCSRLLHLCLTACPMQMTCQMRNSGLL